MRDEKLSVRILESVIMFAVAAFLAAVPTINLAIGPMTAAVLDIIADIVCYAVAVMAVGFGVYNLANHKTSSHQHHYNSHNAKMA